MHETDIEPSPVTDGSFDCRLLNPHLHVVVADGVYMADSAEVWFEALPAPSTEALLEIAERTASVMTAALTDDVSADYDPLTDNEPLLAHCYQRATQGRAVRVLDGEPRLSHKPVPGAPLAVSVDGFGVHAATTVGARDTDERFRLLRYLGRPPLSEERLTVREDGRCVIRFNRRWSDGTRAVVLTPTELIERLCALVPPPRFHLLRYHGVFSAHSKLRSRVVPSPRSGATPEARQLMLPELGDRAQAPPAHENPRQPSSTPTSWAKLLARIFRIDMTVCPRCGGHTRIVDFVIEPGLEHFPFQLMVDRAGFVFAGKARRGSVVELR